MGSRLRSALLASTVAVATVAVPAGTAVAGNDEAVQRDPVTTNERVAQAVGEYWAAHPNDYVGLARTIRAHGGDSVTFAVEGHGAVPARKAQQLYNQSVRTPDSDAERTEPTLLDVPADAFNVTGSWYHVQDQYGEWWSAVGLWNFRDNYINGSDPHDASGIATQVPDCWVNDGDYIYAADYQDNPYEGEMVRQSGGLSNSVYAIDDVTSGFKLLTDHGTHILSFKRFSSGCDGDPLQARYYYEHNQDGGGAWNFSIDLLIFSLSYGDNQPDALQKATQVFTARSGDSLSQPS